MTSKVLIVLLLACAASAASLGEEPLERRADGLIGSLLNWTGNLGQSAIQSVVNGGHMGLDLVQSMVNFGADSLKSGVNMLLRRDLGSDDINTMLNTAQRDLNRSYRAAIQLANQMGPNLNERGRDVLNMYMNELSDARTHYYNSLRDAAYTADHIINRRDTESINYQEVIDSLQAKYAVEMLNYGYQVRRFGNVIKNNGLDL